MFHKTKVCHGLEHKEKVVLHTDVEKQLYSVFLKMKSMETYIQITLGGFMLNLWGQAGKSAFKQAAQGMLSLT